MKLLSRGRRLSGFEPLKDVLIPCSCSSERFSLEQVWSGYADDGGASMRCVELRVLADHDRSMWID